MTEPRPPLLGETGQALATQLANWRLGALLFDDRGRIGRRAFWLYFGAVMLLALVIFFTRSLRQTPAVHLAYAVLLIYPSYAVFAKRLQDMDISGLWAVAMILIPAVDTLLAYSGIKAHPGRYQSALNYWNWLSLADALIMLLLLGGVRGTAGENRFGLRWPPW